jgi:hypothetical protein
VPEPSKLASRGQESHTQRSDSTTDISTEDLTQVSTRISITVGDLRTEAALFDSEAPMAVSALLKALPIADKTVHVR